MKLDAAEPVKAKAGFRPSHPAHPHPATSATLATRESA